VNVFLLFVILAAGVSGYYDHGTDLERARQLRVAAGR
jgi:hypothetical protein